MNNKYKYSYENDYNFEFERAYTTRVIRKFSLQASAIWKVF